MRGAEVRRYRHSRAALVTFTIAALALVGFDAPTGASATALRSDARFVGVYAVHSEGGPTGGPWDGRIRVRADGHVIDQDGGGSWTSKGRSITMNFLVPGGADVFNGKLSRTGIGSRRNPGTWYSDKGTSGTWYGVRLEQVRTGA